MVKIKRETGLLGALSKVKIVVNQQETYLVKNNETIEIDSKKPVIEIQAKQMGMKSKIVQVEANQEYLLKMNLICIGLYFLMLIGMILTLSVSVDFIKILLAVLTIVFGASSVLYGLNNWYIFEKKEIEN